jgi:hypothetical protein
VSVYIYASMRAISKATITPQYFSHKAQDTLTQPQDTARRIQHL